MTDRSFTTTATVDRGAEEVYTAINRPQTWWSTGITGTATTVGDEFVFDSPGHHCWRMRVIDLDPPRRITWQVLDASSTDFVDDPAEWNGTTIHFDIDARDGRTEIRFTHAGLVPEFECFQAARPAGPATSQRSLSSLLTTGRGEPGAY
ncbi:MAG: SRPBCC domain-containing protein [Pseudonocardia sp.]|nr:SRPBCC domain-containing protein [Pseudonocardia sp.]